MTHPWESREKKDIKRHLEDTQGRVEEFLKNTRRDLHQDTFKSYLYCFLRDYRTNKLKIPFMEMKEQDITDICSKYFISNTFKISFTQDQVFILLFEEANFDIPEGIITRDSIETNTEIKNLNKLRLALNNILDVEVFDIFEDLWLGNIPKKWKKSFFKYITQDKKLDPILSIMQDLWDLIRTKRLK